MSTHPSPADLLANHAPALPKDDLAPLLARVRDHRAPTYSRRKTTVRVAAAVSIVAVVVLAVVLIPAGVRSPGGSASALDRLALTAAGSPEISLADGAYVHMVVRAVQPSDLQATGPRSMESWTDGNGRVWRHDTSPDGRQEWFTYGGVAPADGSLGTTPQEIASLPSDPSVLLGHLRPRVGGSLSNDEAVFVYLADALRTGTGPAENRRAMISAMALLPNIETERILSSQDTPCLDVRFAEPERPGSVQAVCFDEDTAAVVEERLLQDGKLMGSSVVLQRDVVTAVPDEVLSNAKASGTGG